MVQPNVHMHPLPAFPQGFSRAAFGDYRDANGVPRGTSAYSGDLNSGTNVALLTPAVVAAAKLHAGCSSLTSAAIENDGGAGACVKRGRRQAVAARRALALPAPPCFLSPPPCSSITTQARPAATGSTASSWCAVVLGRGARLRRWQRPPPRTHGGARIFQTPPSALTRLHPYNLFTINRATSCAAPCPRAGTARSRSSPA